MRLREGRPPAEALSLARSSGVRFGGIHTLASFNRFRQSFAAELMAAQLVNGLFPLLSALTLLGLGGCLAHQVSHHGGRAGGSEVPAAAAQRPPPSLRPERPRRPTRKPLNLPSPSHHSFLRFSPSSFPCSSLIVVFYSSTHLINVIFWSISHRHLSVAHLESYLPSISSFIVKIITIESVLLLNNVKIITIESVLLLNRRLPHRWSR